MQPSEYKVIGIDIVTDGQVLSYHIAFTVEFKNAFKKAMKELSAIDGDTIDITIGNTRIFNKNYSGVNVYWYYSDEVYPPTIEYAEK